MQSLIILNSDVQYKVIDFIVLRNVSLFAEGNRCNIISVGPQVISTIDTKKESIIKEEETLNGKLLVCICLIAMFAVLNFTVAVMET